MIHDNKRFDNTILLEFEIFNIQIILENVNNGSRFYSKVSLMLSFSISDLNLLLSKFL